MHPAEPLSPYTSLAIDAFRKQEAARRRLQAAEDAVLKAVRLVPAAEFDAYVLQTEIVRLEEDLKLAEAHRDREAADHCRLRLAQLRSAVPC